MTVVCPKCDKEHDVTDKLPSCASDDAEVDCDCGVTLTVGWYATAEIRSVAAN